jgi:hypothetical protein
LPLRAQACVLQDGRVMIAGGDDRNADGATALDQVRRVHLFVYLIVGTFAH